MVQQMELKTSLRQRIAVIIVAIVLLGSTAALYIGIVLGYNNSSAVQTADQTRFDELYAAYQTEVNAQAAELSTVHFDTFKEYKSRIKAFNAASVTEIKTEDLKIGTGTEVTENFHDYSAYYIGWLSDEKVFDTSLTPSAAEPTSLRVPLSGGNMIEGWNQGIIGMKLGGIREITIPSELAYGNMAQGDIPENSPLKFVVYLIPKIEEVPWSEEMSILYDKLYGQQLQ